MRIEGFMNLQLIDLEVVKVYFIIIIIIKCKINSCQLILTRLLQKILAALRIIVFAEEMR
jgi:hypothetical protein